MLCPFESGFTPMLSLFEKGKIGWSAFLKAGVDVNETIQPVSVPKSTGYVYARESGARPSIQRTPLAVRTLI